jgi:hypothetical protein
MERGMVAGAVTWSRPARASRRAFEGGAGGGHVGDPPVHEVQVVAADDDLVAVGQDAPLDALAVDEDPVEAAVVEDPHAVGLAHDERVPAGDGGVVEAHVRGQAATDPRPLALERHDPDLVALAPGQVLGRSLQGVADRGHHGVAVVGVAGGRTRAHVRRREERGAHEAVAVAARARGEHVLGTERHDVPALLAPERPGPGQGPRRQRPHEISLVRRPHDQGSPRRA